MGTVATLGLLALDHGVGIGGGGLERLLCEGLLGLSTWDRLGPANRALIAGGEEQRGRVDGDGFGHGGRRRSWPWTGPASRQRGVRVQGGGVAVVADGRTACRGCGCGCGCECGCSAIYLRVGMEMVSVLSTSPAPGLPQDHQDHAPWRPLRAARLSNNAPPSLHAWIQSRPISPVSP